MRKKAFEVKPDSLRSDQILQLKYLQRGSDGAASLLVGSTDLFLSKVSLSVSKLTQIDCMCNLTSLDIDVMSSKVLHFFEKGVPWLK